MIQSKSKNCKHHKKYTCKCGASFEYRALYRDHIRASKLVTHSLKTIPKRLLHNTFTEELIRKPIGVCNSYYKRQ